ncbi:MAG: metallophosphoesterase, partial [Pseudomonadales bacterium]
MNTRISVLLSGILLTLALAASATVKTKDAGEDWRWESVERVVVVADIHGAYPELIGLLQATDVIDESLAWAGGKTHLVSLGDLLDRGAESRSVMELLMRLEVEAAAAGGRVHVVLGNHEHMNLIGDLRYVSDSEYAAFADDEVPQDRTRARERFAANNTTMNAAALDAAFTQRFPPGYFGHRAAFRPGGRYGRWLLSLPTMVVVNDSVFVHGGLPELTSKFAPARLNQSFSNDLSRYLTVWRQLVDVGVLPDDEPDRALELGQNGILEDPSACVEERAVSCEKIEGNGEIEALVTELGELSSALVNQGENPFWYRGSVYCRDILERPILDAYLKRLGVSRLIVGHTPTEDRSVHVIRDGRVVMTDTGMLVSYYKGRPAALVLEQGKKMQVQYLNPKERIAPAIDGRPVAYGLSNSDIETALATGAIGSVERSGDSKQWDVIIEHEGRSIRTLFYPTKRGRPDAMELAAHALDELLGTELVPPTVPRRIEDTDGAL